MGFGDWKLLYYSAGSLTCFPINWKMGEIKGKSAVCSITKKWTSTVYSSDSREHKCHVSMLNADDGLLVYSFT